MESIIQSNIFFFITSISVIIFTIFFIIIAIYLVRIMRNFSHISEALKKGVDNAGEELREMTDHVRDSPIFSFVFGKKKTEKKRKNIKKL